MSRRVRAATLAFALAALVGVTGCGVPQDAAPRRLDTAASPFALPGGNDRTAEETLAAPSTREQVDLYFVQSGMAVRTARTVRLTPSVPVPALLELLLDGPTETERGTGASSVIPSSLTVEDVSVEGQTAVITLGGPEEQVRSTQALAYAQIVATLTGPDGVFGVRFRLDNADLPVPRGDGSLSERPLNRADYSELIAADAPA